MVGGLSQQQPGAREILIVDDDAVIRNLCKSALSGYRIREASNGKDALEIVAYHPVDIILTDVVMPEMGGVDLLINARKMYPDQACIVMTGHQEKQIVLDALKSGASDFIYKPIGKENLRLTVQKVLKQKEIAEELVAYRHLDTFKNEFLSLMTHKLKTPLTSLSLFADAVERGAADIQKDAAGIKQDISSFGDLLSDLIRYSELIAGTETPTREKVYSEALVHNVFLNNKPLAQRKNQIYEFLPESAGGSLMVCQDSVSFAITALIENAVKFTPAGGKIQVKTGRVTGGIAVTVSDNGLGMPEPELRKVFEKFYQVDPDFTGQMSGLGLGLYFARQFVEANGGKLDLNLNKDGGVDARALFRQGM